MWKPFEEPLYISNTKAEDIHDSDSTILQHFRLCHGAIFSLNPSVNIAEIVQIYFFPMEKHHSPYNEEWFPRKSPLFKFFLFKLWGRVGQLESAYIVHGYIGRWENVEYFWKESLSFRRSARGSMSSFRKQAVRSL